MFRSGDIETMECFFRRTLIEEVQRIYKFETEVADRDVSVGEVVGRGGGAEAHVRR